jgi:hypothetical protein
MEYIGFNITQPSKIECNEISFEEFNKRRLQNYNGMTAPVKVDQTIYKSIISFRYYFKLTDKYYEISNVTHVLIKSQKGKLMFNPSNAEAIKCVTEILTEVDILINQFCSHIDDVKDKIKYMSEAEIYSLALVILGGFVFKDV